MSRQKGQEGEAHWLCCGTEQSSHHTRLKETGPRLLPCKVLLDTCRGTFERLEAAGVNSSLWGWAGQFVWEVVVLCASKKS
jgi:hypothetical protein